MNKIVLYDSPEAAEIKTVTGWVSREGVFWGKNEHQARYGGCTHIKCECGNVISKSRIKCDDCYSKISREKYLALPFREYDGSPVVIWNDDKYFFSEDDIEEYLYENEMSEIELLFCREQKWTEVSSDVWEDIMVEEQDFLPDALQAALDNLNKVIAELPPCSYFPGSIRTVYKSKVL